MDQLLPFLKKYWKELIVACFMAIIIKMVFDIERDIKNMESDISEIQSNISEIQSDVSSIENRLN